MLDLSALGKFCPKQMILLSYMRLCSIRFGHKVIVCVFNEIVFLYGTENKFRIRLVYKSFIVIFSSDLWQQCTFVYICLYISFFFTEI